MKRCSVLLFLLIVLVGCTAVPDLAPRTPWYQVSTASMTEKAAAHLASSEQQMNKQGLLLYTAFGPDQWADSGPHYEDYVDSHDVADAPAWQGRLMAAVALEMATTGVDRNDLLLKLANGLKTYYEITGIEGLFGRSYLLGYTGERRSWMETEEQKPTKWWKQEAGGKWWRTGLAKNHFLGACLGCGYALTLAKQGKITLRQDVKDALLAVLLPAVKRFAASDYVILDYNGEPTEFGDLRPNLIPKEYVDLLMPYISLFGLSEEDVDSINKPLNGFNMVLVLAILRSAADYDTEIMTLFNKEAAEWKSGVKWSFQVLGFAVKKVGHWKIGKPSYSDMEAVGFAATYLFMNGCIESDLEKGLGGLWGYMRYERNPCFSIPYKKWVDQSIDISDVIEDLRDFPMPEQKILMSSGKDDTDEVQPLCNRPINSHYWKSSPFRLALPPHEPALNPRGSKVHQSGQDFLVAYWLGRYLGVVPNE